MVVGWWLLYSNNINWEYDIEWGMTKEKSTRNDTHTHNQI